MVKRKIIEIDEKAISETWHVVPNYSRYLVSNYGRVKRKDDNCMIVISAVDDIQTKVALQRDDDTYRMVTIDYLLLHMKIEKHV